MTLNGRLTRLESRLDARGLPLRPLLVVIGGSFAVALVSSVLARCIQMYYDHGWADSLAGTPLWKHYEAPVVATLMGMLFFFVALYILSRPESRSVYSCLIDSVGPRSAFCAIAVALVFVVGVIALRYGRSSFYVLLVDPGGLFALVMGILTVSGTYLAARSITEARQIITSFPELTTRLAKLIEEAPADDEIWFQAFTPAVGSLCVDTAIWKRLRGVMLSRGDSINMICLEFAALELFHRRLLNRSADRGRVTLAMIDASINDARRLLSATKEAARFSPQDIPEHYAFASSHRAIIATPLFLPLPNTTMSDENVASLPPIQMWGFETSDPNLVSAVRRMCTEFAAASHSPKTGDGTANKMKAM